MAWVPINKPQQVDGIHAWNFEASMGSSRDKKVSSSSPGNKTASKMSSAAAARRKSKSEGGGNGREVKALLRKV